jgi:hypothetical protein
LSFRGKGIEDLEVRGAENAAHSTTEIPRENQADGMLQDAAESTLAIELGDVPENILKELPATMPENIPGNVPGNVPDSVQDYKAERTTGNIAAS